MDRPDFERNNSPSQLIDPVVLTADADGESLDLLGYDGAVLMFLIGESGDTLSGSVYLEAEVEESDNDSDWTDVDDGDLTNTVSGTNDGCVAFIDAPAEDDVLVMTEYTGSSRYIRPVVNVTGTHTNGIPVAAMGIRRLPKYPPVS